MGSGFLANSICDSLRVRRVGAGITMRPKERRETGKQDLFRSRLDQIIDLNHALARLARAIDWRFFEERFGAVYTDGPGPPPLPTGVIAGLPLLQPPPAFFHRGPVEGWVAEPLFPNTFAH